MPGEQASAAEREQFHKEMDELHERLEMEVTAIEQIAGSVIMKSADGKVLLYKIHQALSFETVEGMGDSTDVLIAGWTEAKVGKGDGEETTVEAGERRGKLACPTPNDHRHLNIAGQIAKHGVDEVGVLHLGYWIPAQQNPSGPSVSANSIKGVYGFPTVSAFHHEMQEFYQVSMDSFDILSCARC